MQVMKDAAILPEVYAKSLLYRSPNMTNVYVQPYYGMYNYAVLGAEVDQRESEELVPARLCLPAGPAGRQRRAVITFIVRRLIATVFLLIVVSMITFAIFFLLPRLAGQNTYQLATQYVGRNPTPAAVLAIEDKLGLNAPLYLQYGRFLKAIVFGTHYNSGTSTTYCPPPCFGYSFKSQQPVWPQMVSDIPVTLSLAIGAAILWLVGGVAIGVLSALRRGTIFDRFSMGVALLGVSLPIFFTGLISLELFSYKWPIFPNVQFVPFDPEPVAVGAQPGAALDHPGLPLRRPVRPADQGRHAGDDERGLHPHRPGQGPASNGR